MTQRIEKAVGLSNAVCAGLHGHVGILDAEVQTETLTMFAQRLRRRTPHMRESDSRQRRRILVVDDDPLARDYLRSVLTDAGYSATVATDGSDALVKWDREGPFDVLVTDLEMPLMTGDELARCIRRREPRLPVLYVTGYSDHLFEAKPALWLDEAFLEKPCAPIAILDALSILLKGHALEKTVCG
jgi:CheY-like chemotaxis protein